ncbi:hypothetical protein [Phragmitibacter flavus]|uniref:hypothetical protein n=1 Tax=Phragmitibacter flavus TaxID=2576071 RepID=UPI0010FCDFAE|nr:hypothetical protein [Phragmitibacter flavus]
MNFSSDFFVCGRFVTPPGGESPAKVVFEAEFRPRGMPFQTIPDAIFGQQLLEFSWNAFLRVGWNCDVRQSWRPLLKRIALDAATRASGMICASHHASHSSAALLSKR